MDGPARDRLYDRLELVASIAWLGMDYAWMEAHRPSALVLAALACITSLAAVFAAEPRFDPRAVAGAMAAWALMSAFWMCRDLGMIHAQWPGRMCFALGIGLLAAVAIRTRSPRALVRALSRHFRRLRVR